MNKAREPVTVQGQVAPEDAPIVDLQRRLDEYEDVLDADAEGARKRRVVQGTVPGELEAAFKDTVLKLKFSSLSPISLWHKSIESFAIIPLVSWPFWVGYQKRLAPRSLSSIYSANVWGKDWALSCLTPRNLLTCPLAKGMSGALEGRDTLYKNTPEAKSRPDRSSASRPIRQTRTRSSPISPRTTMLVLRTSRQTTRVRASPT